MKLKIKSSQDKKKIIVIAAIVLAIVLVLAVVFVVVANHINNKRIEEQENQLLADDDVVRKILIVSFPKTEYEIGENINLSGLQIQAVTDSMTTSYFVKYPSSELTVTGYDSQTAGDQVITVKYKEFSTTFTVTVKEPFSSSTNANVVKVEVCDMYTTYSLQEWNTYGPSALYAYVKITYSDGTVYGSREETSISRGDFYGYEKMDAPGTTHITVKYVENGETYEITVVINVTE